MNDLFHRDPNPAPAPTIHRTRQIECVDREIHMRQKTYPRWVDRGRMTQAQADNELAVMRSIAATLRDLLEQERTPL